MREILFRGKRVDNGEWAESEYPYGTMLSGVVRHNFNHDTIGQFTGLTDSNGVKIFEGDIVHLYGDKDTDTKCVNYKALVVFVHGGFCAIDGTLENYAVCRFDFTSSLNCEVIGNIYDNPELIKEDN